MKFSQLKRTSLQNPQYTPGPGYYSAVSEKLDQDGLKSEQAPSFSKLERFVEDSFALSRLGPGSYKAQKSDFDKYNFTNHGSQKGSKKGSAEFHRLNVVPSIPSKNVNEGYEDIGNGILVAMKDQLKELDFNVGPGSYNPSYNYCKPRSINVMIKGNEPTALSAKQGFNQQTSLSNQHELIQSRAIGLASGLAVGSEEEKKENYQIPGQRFKSELTSLVSRDPKKAKVGEYNLELLMLRERQLARDERAPAPGKYYNEQLHSSFRVNRKPLEFQCFDSSTQRFVNENAANNPTGPGQYDFTMHLENKGGISFAREKRSTSDASVSKDKSIPGPGDYDINSMIDMGEKDKCDLLRLKQSHMKFFSAFGSGAQRFSNEQTQTPPPGSYNIRQTFNKRKTRTKTVFIQNSRLFSPLKQTLVDQQKPVAIADQSQQNYSQNKQTNQQTAVFKSNTQRFNERRSKSAKNQQSNQSEIGPGFYDVIYDISKQRVSKNIKKDLMDTSARELFERNRLSNSSKVGPGYYEPNIEGVKPKSVFIAAFL